MKNLRLLNLIVALFCSAFLTNFHPCFGGENKLEWRSVVTKINGEDAIRCGHLLMTSPLRPSDLAPPTGMGGATYRSILSTDGTVYTGWLLPAVATATPGNCPHCQRDHGNVNSEVVNIGAGQHQNGSYSVDRSQRLGVALGHYPPQQPHSSQNGMVIDGKFYPEPPETAVKMTRGANGEKLISFNGGQRGASGWRMSNVGNYYYMEGDISIDKSVHGSYNTHNEEHNTTVQAPPPPAQHDYCGYQNSHGHYWCSSNRTWYRTWYAWNTRSCGRGRR